MRECGNLNAINFHTSQITNLFTRAEHQLMHEKHKGHEAMHSEMVLILFVTLIIAQITLVEWKKRHYKSYSVRRVVRQ